MVVRLSALRAGHPLSPGRFLELISVRGSIAAARIMSIAKKSRDLKIKILCWNEGGSLNVLMTFHIFFVTS
jgi:hypothetical protein